MKNRIPLFIAILICISLFVSGCGHEHVWNDATCDLPKTCSECGTTEGDATGHVWVNAVCEAPKTCSVCRATEGEALGHVWKMATCLHPTTCEICGFVPDDILAEHVVDSWTEIIKPSCIAVGSRKGVCKFCAAEITETLEILPHGYSDWGVSLEATCTFEGERFRVCTECGFEEKEVIQKLPHDLQDWVLAKEPAYGDDGEYTQSCASCENVINTKPYTYTESIAHKYKLKGDTQGFEVTDINLVYTKSSWFVCTYAMVEITNTGTNNLLLSNCTFDIVDNEGNLVAVMEEYSTKAGPAIIAPGEKGYFFCDDICETEEIDVSNGMDVFAYITVERTTDACVYLDVVDYSWRGNDPNAIGRIENNTTEGITDYFVFALYRNSNGRICNFGFTWEYDEFAAGDSKSFDAPCTWRQIGKAKDIAECEVIAFQTVR